MGPHNLEPQDVLIQYHNYSVFEVTSKYSHGKRE